MSKFYDDTLTPEQNKAIREAKHREDLEAGVLQEVAGMLGIHGSPGGFTGIITDKLGRKFHYSNGKRVDSYHPEAKKARAGKRYHHPRPLRTGSEPAHHKHVSAIAKALHNGKIRANGVLKKKKEMIQIMPYLDEDIPKRSKDELEHDIKDPLKSSGTYTMQRPKTDRDGGAQGMWSK